MNEKKVLELYYTNRKLWAAHIVSQNTRLQKRLPRITAYARTAGLLYLY